MNKTDEILSKIKKLKKISKRYEPEAYSFILNALDFTMSKLPKRRHINGRELLEGIRRYALDQFGPMAKTVFEYWGISNSLDFGEIVFDLVGAGLLSKQEEDRLEDFKDSYDFDKVFGSQYEFPGD